jgi:hypothetical protein
MKQEVIENTISRIRSAKEVVYKTYCRIVGGGGGASQDGKI